jgi:tetratricopeptide (TPR) repeat protein
MLNKKNLKLWFLTASVCLAGLSLSNINVNAREESIEARLFKKLEVAAEQGRLKESKADIKRVLKLNPRHPGATFYAGKYAYESNDFANAEKFLHRVENHSRYGTEARKILAEIRLDRFKARYLDTLNVALAGEAFTQALSLCDEILAEMPDNKDVFFLGAYAATMNGDKDRAESFLQRYQKTNGSQESKAELKAFTDAIFAAGYSPETSVEKLMNISDSRLLTPAVRRKLKELIVGLRELELFEKFIIQEKSRPGSDIDKLERELIEFLIEQKQYQKAMDLVNRRPTTQIEDNVLFLRLLVLTGQEIKAMLTARQLLSAHPTDLRLYDSWTEAWLGYVDRTSETPQGNDEAGKSFDEMAEEVLDRLKLEMLVKMQPNLLLRLVRLAVLSQNEPKVKETTSYATKISFNQKNVDLLLETVEKLVSVNRSSIGANLLESARNQLPDDHRLSIKLGEIYFYNNNPEVAAKIFEDVLREKPEQIRAFLLWTDCMTSMNQGIKAEEAILQRLENPDLNEIVRRQLTNKLEVIRMQNVVGTEEPDYQSQTGEVPPKQQENPEDGYDEENSGEDSLQETEGKEIEEEIEENTDEQ